jgi:hypothetical protein
VYEEAPVLLKTAKVKIYYTAGWAVKRKANKKLACLNDWLEWLFLTTTGFYAV